MLIRRAGERGYADHGWLRSFHTFSFADYYAPAHMGFRSLRVINEDRVEGGKGFGTHPHRDMEIISYVLSGALQHKDSMGTGSIIKPGDVQRMSAGTGVTHSEFNASPTELVHFLQIWILPDARGHAPSYEQKHFDEAERQGKLRLVASKDGAEGSLTIHQDARLYAGLLAPGDRVAHTFGPERYGWVHVARGKVALAGQELAAGDAAAFEKTTEISIEGSEPSEILLFDLS
jgi:redox-sensitive bicupin YhaK (pirin superfamily)